MKTLMKFALTTALCLATAPAFAQSQGDMTLGLGIGAVLPKSDNLPTGLGVIEVDNGAAATITFEYFIRDNIGIELLAATPFTHDITLDGALIGETKHLPPTLSLNYHFPTDTMYKPYVGIGLNYTTFFEEAGNAAVGSLTLDDSFGLALQAGADFQISESGSLRLNVRYIDIDTDAVSGNLGALGTVEIDPWFVGIAYVHKF